MGVHTTYTVKIGKQICDNIMMGWSLNDFEKDITLPCKKTICNWLFEGEDNLNEEKVNFLHNYARARQIRCDCLREDIVDVIKGVDSDNYNAARVKIQGMTWLLANALPKKYHTHSTADNTVNDPRKDKTLDAIDKITKAALKGFKKNGRTSTKK